jgi:hypothetical protein
MIFTKYFLNNRNDVRQLSAMLHKVFVRNKGIGGMHACATGNLVELSIA